MRSEVELVSVQIERAEKWLALQKGLMRQRHAHGSPLYAATMEDLAELLETRVSALYQRQRHLSQQQSAALGE